MDVDPKRMAKHLLNRAIPADDLRFNEREQRLLALSDEDVDDVMKRCKQSGITDPSQIKAVIAWCCKARIGEILYRSLVAGQVRITGFSGDEPRFTPVDEATDDDLDWCKPGRD
jgi:hypothetical protein